MTNLKGVWNSYTLIEKRNIAFYIGGIMFYKLGLEFFNGSITTLASDRFASARTFTKLGAAQGINQAAQCVGAILIGPLVKRWPTRSVLSVAIFVFALMTTILLIVDAGTGGKIKPAGASKPVYGSWNPNIVGCVSYIRRWYANIARFEIFVIWTFSGIVYGMVELVRRVIPADIVGGDVQKLRRMDATVHVFYEVAGTIGAFASSSAISRWGNNYSFFLTPVFFAFAGVTWLAVSALTFRPRSDKDNQDANLDTPPIAKQGYVLQFFGTIIGFAESLIYGARFLESSLAPAFAKRVLTISAWSQIIVGGSNFGELLGALSVFLLSDYVTSPLPWLRLDALMLNIVWILPYFATIATPNVEWAWKVAGCFIPISFGWAAGDVSLAAYIQSSLSDAGFDNKHVSPLGAVMAILYSIYIILNAIFSSVLGKVIDDDFTATGNIESSLKRVAGIQFSVCSGIILLATFIPIGAFALNPKFIGHSYDSEKAMDQNLVVVEGKGDKYNGDQD
ncbi:hypothetical protein BU17DRAFT_96156 [Hysterangium stoloniferum]|nr:hypothetical protein BU17DRAFT_96156 [Hysterangium stoloniferum]